MPPLITRTVAETRQAVAGARGRKQTVGLVPTMGALHAGHLSLIRAARAQAGFVVVSVFVNPAQFGPQEDLSRYPRPFEKDVALCAAEGVELIFHPDPATMYPPDYRTFVEVHELQDALCGSSRPGHFRGVATVVLKLLHIVQPDLAFFGQKDAQQTVVLRQMIHDLDLPVRLEVCPTVRESDGLALSSRNAYLNADQRKEATVLFRALEKIRGSIAAGERRSALLLEQATRMIAQTPEARLDYVSIVDAQSLQPIETLRGRVLIALAVFIGNTRLIDNLILQVKE